MSPKASLAILVLGLAAVASFRGPAPAAAEPPVALSTGHAHDNLTVFILRGPDVLEGKNILTLQEALERKLAVVHETSNVNMLEVENLSPDHELFLQSGDIVKGGKQDRLVSRDLLIPAHSGKVACPANCCEHNRWQGRGQEAAGKFEKSTDFAVGNDIKIANVRQQQGAVWEKVAKCQDDLSRNLGKQVTANPSPSSLQLALEDKDLRAKVAGYERDLAGLSAAYPDAVGVVIAVNGQVIASDVYGSRQLFQKAWPKLLKSAAVDAVAQMPKDGAAAVATREEAEKFLATNDQREAERAKWETVREQLARGVNDFRVQDNVNLPAFTVVDVAGIGARLDGTAVQASQGVATQPQGRGFTGRSGATSEQTVTSGGGQNGQPAANGNAFSSVAQNEFSSWQLGHRVDIPIGRAASNPAVNPTNAVNDNIMGNRAPPQPVIPTPAVVSFESRAGAQGNALIHRGQLKK